MKMFEIHEGSGTGVEKFRYVFVFDNEKVFYDSVNSGCESGRQVSAKTSTEKGGAMQGAAAFPTASGCINSLAREWF